MKMVLGLVYSMAALKCVNSEVQLRGFIGPGCEAFGLPPQCHGTTSTQRPPSKLSWTELHLMLSRSQVIPGREQSAAQQAARPSAGCRRTPYRVWHSGFES